MRNQRLNYVVVGIFTLAMLVVGIGSMVMLSGRTGETDAYHLVLDNVADVKFGTQVRFEGYPIGQVERVVPFAEDGRMRFRVELAVERGWKISSASVARIGSSSLLSAKTIDISRGVDAGAEVLAPGAEIASAPSVDMFAIVSGLAEEFGDLSRDGLRPLIDDVGRMTRRLGNSFQSDLSRLMTSLNTTASAVETRAETIARRMDSITAELDKASVNLGHVLSEDNVASVRRVLVNIEATSQSVAATSKKLALTRAKVDDLIKHVDSIVADNRGAVDNSLTNLQYTLRSVARTIDSVMFNIDSTGRNMSEFSRMIRQNPGLLLGGGRRDEVTPASRAGSGGYN